MFAQIIRSEFILNDNNKHYFNKIHKLCLNYSDK